jgi:4'-phosphopantetheinyl transferase
MDVYWLEQTEAEVPLENDWLSAGELARLDALRFPKRRADWRLGRWTAKCALAAHLGVPALPRVLAEMEVRPAPSGAPEAFLANQPAPATISLSHRSGVSMCAVARHGVKLGCDLEMVEPHSDAFVEDYFTDGERELIARASASDRSRLLALLWSGKESTLKALHEGLRLDTRCVVVNQNGGSYDLNGWGRLHVVYAGHRAFHGWWRHAGGMLRTLIAEPRPNPPVHLQAPAYRSDYVGRCA